MIQHIDKHFVFYIQIINVISWKTMEKFLDSSEISNSKHKNIIFMKKMKKKFMFTITKCFFW